ncbi:MAG: MFS transporter [Gammaproteobacteria bacterium]|nr:MFS transporter [Gammaproteobacteria bacterium]
MSASEPGRRLGGTPTALNPRRDPAPSAPARHPRAVLAATILSSSLAFVDGSVVNVGLPALRAALHADPAALQWVINAYLLPLSALLLLGGAVGDRFGQRRTLLCGVAAFALASALCALAPSLAVLLGARAVQGTAAAFMLPNSLAVLSGAFTGSARGRAVGLWAAVGAAVSAVGPVLGGGLIDAFGWRTLFLINLPLAAAALGLIAVAVPPDAAGSRQRLDVLGTALATAALGLLAWALTVASGPVGWTRGAVVATLAAAAMFVVFVRTESTRGARAALPLSLFRSRAFVGLTLLTLLVYGALSALLVLVPFVLIETEHYAAAAAGAALLPLPIVLAVLSPLAGSLSARWGSRPLLGGGALLVAAGCALFARFGGGQSYALTVGPALVLVSIGMSGVAAPLTSAVLACAGAETAGAASGFNSAISRVGGTFATALLGSVLGASGAALLGPFHVAALACAAACVLAAALVLTLLRE